MRVMTTRLEEIAAFETQRAKQREKDFKHDLAVVLASSCLLIVFLHIGIGIYGLMYALREPIARAIAGIKDISLDEATETFKAFYNSEILENVVQLIVTALYIIVPVLAAKKLLRNKPKNIYPLKLAFPQKAGSFIFFSMGICYTVTLICSLIFGDIYPDVSVIETNSGLLTVIVNFILIVIVAPFGEELLFRGVFYQGLAKYSQPFAIFLSALIFGLAHRNPPQVINAFVMGICLAIGFAKTGSITLCVLIHLANNAFSFMLSYLISDDSYILTVLISIAVIGIMGFAMAMMISFAVTKKSGILNYDEIKSDYPRLSGRRARVWLVKNPLFYIFIALVSAGVALLYIKL